MQVRYFSFVIGKQDKSCWDRCNTCDDTPIAGRTIFYDVVFKYEGHQNVLAVPSLAYKNTSTQLIQTLSNELSCSLICDRAGNISLLLRLLNNSDELFSANFKETTNILLDGYSLSCVF